LAAHGRHRRATLVAASVTDVDDMYRRLSVISRQLEELGLTHEKNYGMLLRRLAASENTGPLAHADIDSRTVKQYRRYQMRPQTMLSPLTGLVDAARPDSEAARQFDANVDAFSGRCSALCALSTEYRSHFG